MATDPEKVATEVLAAWNSHDVERVLALFADEFVYEDVPVNVMMMDKKEVAATASWLFTGFPDVKFEHTGCFHSNNRVCTEWVMTGTNSGNVPGMAATGRTILIRGASVIEIKGNNIIRQSDYYHSERKPV